MMRNEATAEEWLHTAVENLDKYVFEGELDAKGRKFQIYFGRVKGKKESESVLPSDNDQIDLNDFFPITIGIDYKIRDVNHIMEVLAMECIKSFLGISKGKLFKKTCDRFYFEPPFDEPHPTPYLKDLLNDALKDTINQVGEFPWKAIKFPVKEKKDKKPNKVVFFCPECGMEYTVSIKQLKDNHGTPTCICGAKTGRVEDEKDSNAEDQNNAN